MNPIFSLSQQIKEPEKKVRNSENNSWRSRCIDRHCLAIYALFNVMIKKRNATLTRVDENEAKYWRDSHEFDLRLYGGLVDFYETSCKDADKLGTSKKEYERERQKLEEISKRHKEQASQEDERAQQIRQKCRDKGKRKRRKGKANQISY